MAPHRPERSRTRAALRWAIILAALLLLARSAREASGRELADRLASIGPWVLLVLVPGALSVLFQTAGWRLLLRPMGLAPAWGPLLRVRLAAEALYVSAPGGGAVADAASVLLLGREAGIPAAPALAAVAGRKLAIVLANGLSATLAFSFGFATILGASRALGLHATLPWVVAASAVLLFAVGFGARALAGRGTVANALRRQLERLPLVKLRSWLTQRASSFEAIDTRLAQVASCRPLPLGVATLAYVASWLLEVSETWLLLRLLGIPVSFPNVVALDLLVGLLRSAAFVVPGGLGVQDAAYVSLLQAMAVGNSTLGLALVVLKRGRDVFWTAVGLGLMALSTARARRSTAHG